MIITLQPWEYQHASNVGIARYAANWGKPDASHYKKDRMEDDRTATVAAAICELAVAKATNRYWHAHIWHASEHRRYRHLPDVGHNIEVRRIRDADHSKVAVRRHQTGQNLVIFAAHPIPPEFRQVDVIGWMLYDEAWELGTPWAQDNSVRYVDRCHFHDPPGAGNTLAG